MISLCSLFRLLLCLEDLVFVSAATNLACVDLAVLKGMSVVELILVIVLVCVGAGWNPLARLAILVWRILSGQVVTTLSITSNEVAAPLGKIASTSRELRVNGGLGVDPVRKGVLAVLDNSLAGLVTVVCRASFSWSNRSVVDQLKKVLSVAGDNRHLLAVLAKSIELVAEGSLELFTSDVRELSLCDERLGLSTDELLLENDDSWRVWLLILELSNLVGNLLLA